MIDANSYDRYDFIGMIVYEALRFKSPAPATSNYEFVKDCQVGKYSFKKGDKIAAVIHLGVHYNTSQWIRPNEFIPERFDPKSPLFLTPDGKKRNGYAWLPFSGGPRVCIGKTFAEINLKIISLYMSELFEIEFKDKEKYAGPTQFPEASAFQGKTIPVEVILRARK